MNSQDMRKRAVTTSGAAEVTEPAPPQASRFYRIITP